MEILAAGSGVIADVEPAWPFRMPTRGGPDGVSRIRDGIYERLATIDGCPVLVRAWQRLPGRVIRLAALPVEEAWIGVADAELAVRRRAGPGPAARRRAARGPATRHPPRRSPRRSASDRPRAERPQLETALRRARAALGLDDDLSDFYARFKRDPLLGPAIRRAPWLRARRCLCPWEALAWAITEQLIEVERAHAIQRRIVARWGLAARPPDRRRALRSVPTADELAARAPAELAALDLAPKRAVAMVKVAREVAAGRIDPDRVDHDPRLLAISEIGPWTVQVLGMKGRGDPDSLPAGDLAYLKLVPRLVGMDRRATVAEVEDFYAPYAPYRGWAGLFTLAAGPAKRQTRPLRYHPPRPEAEAA